MLASIPANEMAETLRVLAGDNAANAARHFTRRSRDMGDASSAVLWSSIAQVLMARSAAAPAAAAGLAPESAAMRGVRYEDVDAETLAQEERTPIFIGPASVRTAPAGPIPQRARAPKRYGFVRAPGPAGNGRPDGAAAPALAQAA